MGKTIDDLRKQVDERPDNALDEPLGEAVERAEGDVRRTEWYQFVAEIDELTESDDYTFALDTLTGIRETVERTKRVTEGQRRAISNIRLGGEGRRRRYEGYERRWR